MAKRIVDEEMRFSIIINGDEAQKELHQLEANTRKLNASNKTLRAERDKLRAQGKQNTAEYKKLTASINQNNKEVKANQLRMKQLQQQIGVTGLTMAQLQKRASQLRLQLRNMVPGSAQYKKLQADLQATSARIAELRTQANVSRMSLSKLADGFNRYAALGASVIAAGTGMALSFSKLIDFQGELSDVQSDVMKTTGLTKVEVDELTKSLGQLNTRTSTMELLALGEEAGRLGIEGVENVRGFIQTANLLKVALGKELSDEAIREVGKMSQIFKVGEQTGRNFEESMESLGSAINHIAMSGANTADYLVDFMKRTAGVAGVADIQADKIIGIAAAFDELGQSREVSATAINKTLLSMGKDVEKFARVAGVSVGEFSKLLEEDANEALITFLEGLQKGNPTMEEMSRRLEGIEVGGTRGVQAIAALAGNTELLRKRQIQANQAMMENTSLQDEYNIKNENTAALLAKIRRRFVAFFMSDEITNGIGNAVNWVAKFVGAAEDADGSVARFRNGLVQLIKVITVLIVSYISYNAAVKLTALITNTAAAAQSLLNAVQQRGAIFTNLLRTSTLLLQAVYYLLTGNITRATAALRLFNATARMNPLGLLLTVIGGIVTALILFKKRTNDVTTEINKLSSATDVLNKRNEEVSKSLAQEASKLRSKVGPLIQVLNDQNSSLETRKKAYEALVSISPDFIGTVDDEFRAVKDLEEIYGGLIIKLKQKLRIEANQNTMAKFYQAQADAVGKVVDKEIQLAKVREKIAQAEQKGFDSGNRNLIKQLKAEEKAIEAAVSATKLHLDSKEKELGFFEKWRESEIKRLQDILATLIKGTEEYNNTRLELESLLGSAINDPEREFNEKTKNSNSGKAKEKTNFQLKNLESEYEALARIRKKIADLEANDLETKFKKEMQLLKNNHEEKLRTLQNQLVKEKEIAEVELQLDLAKNDGNQEAINNFTEVLEIWKQKNIEVNKEIELQKKQHNVEISNLIHDAIQDEVNAMEEAYKERKKHQESFYNEELEKVAHSERKTRQLKEQFRQQELEDEKTHIKYMEQTINDILDQGTFQDFNLNLLSEEEKNAIRARLQELGLDISEINLLLAQMQGKEKQDALDDLGLGGNTDILGFTPGQWDAMFDNFDNLQNVIESTIMAFAAMSEAYAMFADFQTKKDEERLRRFESNNRKEADQLKANLDQGFIKQRQYNEGLEELDKQLEQKKKEIAKNQERRQKIMALNSIAINTAQAIMSIWAQVPKFDFGISAGVLTGIVTALGAAQAGMVLSTKGYQDGLYKDTFPVQREQDGKMFNAGFGGESRSGLVDQPTVFLAGEQGKTAPEMIISGGDWAQMNPEIKQSISREVGRVRGYQNGMYQEEDSSSSVANAKLLQMIDINNSFLQILIQDGILANVIANESNAREINKAIEKYKKRKESSKL